MSERRSLSSGTHLPGEKSYTAELDALADECQRIAELSAFAVRIGEDFRVRTADTSWTGDDSFGRQLRARYVKSTTAAHRTIEAVSAGVAGIGAGTRANLQEIRAARNTALDDIEALGTAYGT
ncbi:hypothetical protein [Streptomyces zaomyceticus]|uniref:hypothetical protein n=1 Tax=Streptomyces zaomyceticus TaxID=68286 RepID=UPI00368DE68C